MQTSKLLWCAVCQRCWQAGLRLWVAAVCLWTAGMAQAQSVVFINPGMSDEIFWTSASDAMRKAADSLGMQLQVVTVERDRLKPMEVAQSLAQLPPQERPDYVLFGNEYSVAPSVLKALEGPASRRSWRSAEFMKIYARRWNSLEGAFHSGLAVWSPMPKMRGIAQPRP